MAVVLPQQNGENYMRSDLQTEERINEAIDVYSGKDVEATYKRFESINKEQIDAGLVPNFSPIIDSVGLRYMQCVPLAYTRGDSMQSIDTNFMQPAVQRLLRATGEIRKYEAVNKIWFWPSGHNDYFGQGMHLGPAHILSIYTFYSWLLCFGTPKSEIEELSHFITQENVCSSVDGLVAHFLPGRSIGNENSEQNALFDIWTQLFTATGGEQIAAIKSYLDNWANYLSNCKEGGLGSLATLLSLQHKSNDTLPNELTRQKHVTWYGFWAWEIALVVKLYNLDDSEFRDHPLYPVDAVDYLKS